MASIVTLDNEICRLRKRIRLLLVERWGLFGASAGALVACALVLLSSVYVDLINYRLWAGVVIAGALVGVGLALFKKLSDLTVATAADRRTGLKERLSTAVVVTSAGEMEDALRSDAGEKIGHMKSREVFRHRFGLPHWVFAGSLALLLGIVFLPQTPALQSKERQQEVAVMKQEGQNLENLAKELRESDPKNADARRLAAKLEQLGEKMQTGRMSRKDAMLQLQRLSKDIAREQERIAKENSPSKTMDQASSEMRQSAENLAQSMAEEMAKKENMPPQEALKKLPSDQQLAQLARKDAPLTQEEKKQLEQAVSKYADPNNNAPIPSELGEAIARLAQNKDFQKASQLMQQLAQKMNSGKMGQADQKMLNAQMNALANALKNTDLDKLAKQMANNAQQLAQMSPEQLKQMAQQMQNAQQLAQALQKAGAGSQQASAALGQSGLGDSKNQMASSGKQGNQSGQGSQNGQNGQGSQNGNNGGSGGQQAGENGSGGQDGSANGGGSGGLGNGRGGDDSNSGPRGQLNPSGNVERAPSHIGASGTVYSAGESQGAPDVVPGSGVPYTSVFPEYKKAAESALAQEKVPPAYRNRVKDYFNSLNR